MRASGRVALLLQNPNDYLLHERVADEAIAALCAEAVGVMSAICDMTVAYLKTRKQFGRPIGAFQALQHRAADMFIALEQARSMAVYATMMVGEADVAQRSAAISAAKVTIGKNGRFIGEQAVQLKVAEKAVEAYAQLAQKNNTMIVPGNMTEVSALIGTAMTLMKRKAS